MEHNALKLMHHEGKAFAKVSLDTSNYEEITISNRKFYTVSTPVFRAIITEVLLEATKKFPEKFGTNRTDTVLDALFHLDPVVRRENFESFLSQEQFCYVFEIIGDKINDRVLRIDLFRDTFTQPNGESEFRGGVLHAFKHYSYDGVRLSTGRE